MSQAGFKSPKSTSSILHSPYSIFHLFANFSLLTANFFLLLLLLVAGCKEPDTPKQPAPTPPKVWTESEQIEALGEWVGKMQDVNARYGAESFPMPVGLAPELSALTDGLDSTAWSPSGPRIAGPGAAVSLKLPETAKITGFLISNGFLTPDFDRYNSLNRLKTADLLIYKDFDTLRSTLEFEDVPELRFVEIPAAWLPADSGCIPAGLTIEMTVKTVFEGDSNRLALSHFVPWISHSPTDPFLDYSTQARKKRTDTLPVPAVKTTWQEAVRDTFIEKAGADSVALFTQINYSLESDEYGKWYENMRWRLLVNGQEQYDMKAQGEGWLLKRKRYSVHPRLISYGKFEQETLLSFTRRDWIPGQWPVNTFVVVDKDGILKFSSTSKCVASPIQFSEKYGYLVSDQDVYHTQTGRFYPLDYNGKESNCGEVLFPEPLIATQHGDSLIVRRLPGLEFVSGYAGDFISAGGRKRLESESTPEGWIFTSRDGKEIVLGR